jgi:hypothetical protein
MRRVATRRRRVRVKRRIERRQITQELPPDAVVTYHDLDAVAVWIFEDVHGRNARVELTHLREFARFVLVHHRITAVTR